VASILAIIVALFKEGIIHRLRERIRSVGLVGCRGRAPRSLISRQQRRLPVEPRVRGLRTRAPRLLYTWIARVSA
jgi:hypothetical protein